LVTPFTTSIFLAKDGPQHELAVKHHARLLEIYRSLGVKVIDLNEKFSSVPNIDQFFAWAGFYYGHPNERGYALFADEVLMYINKNCDVDYPLKKLITCR